MFFDLSDYNVPPCCSQKYFRFLTEHLYRHPNTTLFVLPDYDLQRTIERVLIHVPKCDLTLALPRPDDKVVKALIAGLDRPWTDVQPGGVCVQTHQLVNLRLIIAPPADKEDPQNHIVLPDLTPRNSLLKAFEPYGDRVHIYEDNIATTILHLKHGEQELSLYGDILQTSPQNNKDTTLRLLHATTDPQILKEISSVLRMHCHHEQTLSQPSH